MLNFKTVAELSADIAHAAPALVGEVDVVVGVPRSGVLAASLLALHAQTPLSTVDEVVAGVGPAVGVGSVLLIDDTVCGGGTMRRAVAAVREARSDLEIVRAAVYRAPGTGRGAVDRYVATLATPRAFEWNIWRSVYLPNCAMDLDGVICQDPDVVDDDGPRYQEHVERAVPRWIPRRPVLAIVTCRLERWRRQTEAWLARHGVAYRSLRMMDYPTAQARRDHGRHAAWKAEVYRDCGAWLFVESARRQATAIARATSLPVWCTDDRTLYGRSS